MDKKVMDQVKADFADRSAKVTDQDVRDTLGKRSKAEAMVRCSKVLREYWEDVRTFFGMVQDYVSGKYRTVPFGTIAAIVGAIAYLVSPIDVIPDVIPVFGLLDDAAVLGLCMKFVHSDVEEYRRWKAAVAA